MTQPLFVKVQQYDDAKEVIGIVQQKLNEARQTIGKIHDLRHQEEEELNKWSADLSHVEERIQLMQKTFSEGRE
ncbi:hypothetical protein HYU19_05380 [Candidatus Woesearchaeota archaeon]|nr:hypothetical protein [Candidatus Woesearchaeota archaeon]